jgi:hypothetical protein
MKIEDGRAILNGLHTAKVLDDCSYNLLWDVLDSIGNERDAAMEALKDNCYTCVHVCQQSETCNNCGDDEDSKFQFDFGRWNARVKERKAKEFAEACKEGITPEEALRRAEADPNAPTLEEIQARYPQILEAIERCRLAGRFE